MLPVFLLSSQFANCFVVMCTNQQTINPTGDGEAASTVSKR
jgi:hypothetical protein